MPKLDGFEVLELIQTEAAIVFVTAYDSTRPKLLKQRRSITF